MASVNKVIIVGNIGKEPVVRAFNNGGKVVQFSVATSKKYRDANGEMKEETAWHNIRIAGKSADSFEKCGVKKGTPIYLEGEISYRTWNDNAGIRHDMTEIVCFTFQLLGSRQQGNGNASQAYDYANPQQQTQASAPSDEDLDGLPF
jgi:single-strand DNA-binding protein